MLTLLLLAALAQAPESGATAPPALAPATHELFERTRRRVAQVRIIERRSGSRSSIGSAFFINAQGHALTNYHVVSSIVHRPEDYTAELVREGHLPAPVRLVDVDVVNDLALVQLGEPVADFFELEPQPPPQGTRLFALGNPHDLGTTIVEGTYNGLVADALYERVHFSGAINPGMSGGPTVNGAGRVVGVNVATMGNQLGFLVPVAHARALLERTRAEPPPSPTSLLSRVGAQLLANQQRITERLLSTPPPTQPLGNYRVAGRWAPFLKCWGDTPHSPELPYTSTSYQCATEEDLYLSSEHRTGVVSFSHRHLASVRLGALRFAALYGAHFAEPEYNLEATREDVTNYRCRTDFVESAGLLLRVAFCLRAYRKFPGLYDLSLRAATLDSSSAGVQTSLTLAGFSAANARTLAHRYLEAFAWTR